MYFNAYQVYLESSISNIKSATKIIKVICDKDLNWTCKVNGNFGLNIYEGVGPTTDNDQSDTELKLEISYFDDEEKDAYGEITFNYIKDGCLKHTTIPIFYSEKDDWLTVFPTTDVYSRNLANEYKVFTIKTNILPIDKIEVNTPPGLYDYFITKDLKLYLIKLTSINNRIQLLTSINKDGNGNLISGIITVVEMP